MVMYKIDRRGGGQKSFSWKLPKYKVMISRLSPKMVFHDGVINGAILFKVCICLMFIGKLVGGKGNLRVLQKDGQYSRNNSAYTDVEVRKDSKSRFVT